MHLEHGVRRRLAIVGRVMLARLVPALGGALLLLGCAGAPCKTATCEARRLVDGLARRQGGLDDRRLAFAAARDDLALGTCPEGKVPRGTLCAARSAAGRTVELHAALDPVDPRESKYTLGLAVAGRGAPLDPPGLGAPYGHTLAEEPGWLVAGGVLLIRPLAGTLAWISPKLVGDPLDRLEADALPQVPRWGEIRIFLAVQSRWRAEFDPYRREYQFSPRADDGPRETTTIVAELRHRPGEREPDDTSRVDALQIVATRDEAALEPAWVASWLRDLHLADALPALEAAATQAATTDCVRAAKHGNFAITWSIRRQGPNHVHTITASRRLHAVERFPAAPFNLCPEARGVFSR